MGRAHRGADPEDRAAFDPAALPALRAAVAELSWLLGRGYAERAALQLVGDRHQLSSRQRAAIRRCAAPDVAVARRAARRVELPELAGQPLWIDGFNVLITVERALAGGVVLQGRDGALRDLAGVHGTWRAVAETDAALRRIARVLRDVGPVRWLLDRPVSNSGRLAARIRAMAQEAGRDWAADVVDHPDAQLIDAPCAVATSDAGVLDRASRWTPLAGEVVDQLADAWVIRLGDPPG